MTILAPSIYLITSFVGGFGYLPLKVTIFFMIPTFTLSFLLFGYSKLLFRKLRLLNPVNSSQSLDGSGQQRIVYMYYDGTTESEISSRLGSDKRLLEDKVRSVEDDWQIEPEIMPASPASSNGFGSTETPSFAQADTFPQFGQRRLLNTPPKLNEQKQNPTFVPSTF